MTCVARVMPACVVALLLGALLLPPPARAETSSATEKTYDAPPHLRDIGRLLRDLFKQERWADLHAICQQGYTVCVLPTSGAAPPSANLFERAVAHLANREAGGDAEIEKAAALLEDALQAATSQEERDRAAMVLGLCYRWLGQADKAISLLREVAASSPDLVVDLPEAKIRRLNPVPEIGRAYRDNGDWRNALWWWEAALTKRPDARALISSAVQARRLLAAAGQVPSSAMVLGGGGYLPSAFEGNSLLVPAAKFAEGLRMEHARDEASGAVTLTKGDQTLTLRAGDATAIARVAPAPHVSIPLPAAPQEKDGDLVVPLRAVAEYFGFTVRWDPAIKLAQVH